MRDLRQTSLRCTSQIGKPLSKHKDFGAGKPLITIDDGLGPVYLQEFLTSDTQPFVDLWRKNRPRITPWLAAIEPVSKDAQMLKIMVDDSIAGAITLTPLDEDESAAAISYWVDENFIRMHVATIAVSLASQYAVQTLGLEKVEAYVQPTNAASIKVLTNVGYKLRRRTKTLLVAHERTAHDVYVYGT